MGVSGGHRRASPLSGRGQAHGTTNHPIEPSLLPQLVSDCASAQATRGLCAERDSCRQPESSVPTGSFAEMASDDPPGIRDAVAGVDACGVLAGPWGVMAHLA